ncbi:hypothetical protein BDV96DRAFT_171356 [Lophiotrema nucula]|uniref:C2H2-type domain-containing protein n=1 Tax=Lophiotrema nucula TaxID=690887 RepID=A0A6A5Z010_9PLEO|nr:hypothetical protein BDV96DRAFT_171356 [Lophiotrema nucula]
MASVPSAPASSAPPAPPAFDSSSSHHYQHQHQHLDEQQQTLTIDQIREAVTWFQTQGKDPVFCVEKHIHQERSGYAARARLLAKLPGTILRVWDAELRSETTSQALQPGVLQSSLPITPQSAGHRPADNAIQPAPSRAFSGGIRDSINSTHDRLNESLDIDSTLDQSTFYGGGSSSTALHADASYHQHVNGFLNPSLPGGTPAPALPTSTSNSYWQSYLPSNQHTPTSSHVQQPTGVDYQATQPYPTNIPHSAGDISWPSQANNNTGMVTHASNSGLTDPSANASSGPTKPKSKHTPRQCCGNNWACDAIGEKCKRKADGTVLWAITFWRPHYKSKHLGERDQEGWLHCTHCTYKLQGPDAEPDILNHIYFVHMRPSKSRLRSSLVNDSSPSVNNILSTTQDPPINNNSPAVYNQLSTPQDSPSNEPGGYNAMSIPQNPDPSNTDLGHSPNLF